MSFYLQQNPPSRKYDVAFDAARCVMTVRIDFDTWEAIEPFLKTTVPVVRGYQTRCPSLPPFVEPTDQELGFGSAMNRIIDEGSDIVWGCSLTPVGGPSKNLAIICTLSIVFMVLNMIESRLLTPPDRAQLMEVDLSYRFDCDMHRCPISATLGPNVTRWLKTASRGARSQIEGPVLAAMRAAYASMMKRPDDPHDRFLAEIGDRVIVFQVPGDASTLSGREEGPDRGMELASHNVDASIQQLSLLAGLGALCTTLRTLGL